MTNAGANSFDYIIVGGGTAGCIIAHGIMSRTESSVLLIESGPSDENFQDILELRKWATLQGGVFDYNYRIEPQEVGNSNILLSRAKVLGGCSSHNACISFKAPSYDLEIWGQVASHWGPTEFSPYYDRVLKKVKATEIPKLNPCASDFVRTAVQLGFPETSFNQSDLSVSTGWFQLNVNNGLRQSSSVAYLHPIKELPKRLTILTETDANKIYFDNGGRAVKIHTSRGEFAIDRELILCCGTYNTPKLLMLSGIGPKKILEPLGIGSILNMGEVGENLMDHLEGIVLFESKRPIPPSLFQDWEVGLFASFESSNSIPQIMIHYGTVPFDTYTVAAGYPTAQHAISICPNIMRPKSRGWVGIRSADSFVAPIIDHRYLTDVNRYDEYALLSGIELSRRLGSTAPLKDWIESELAPGEMNQSPLKLAKYIQKTSNTVYHPAGTCRMGKDSDSVVDPFLKLRNAENVRIADASVFPSMIGVNIGITVMAIAEKCVDFIVGILEGE